MCAATSFMTFGCSIAPRSLASFSSRFTCTELPGSFANFKAKNLPGARGSIAL